MEVRMSTTDVGGAAHLMQAGEGQLHLGFHAHRSHDGEVRRGLEQVLEQRRLPDPRLASEDQGPALATSDILKQPVERGALGGPPAQPVVRPIRHPG
jgi:hypothetical protein